MLPKRRMLFGENSGKPIVRLSAERLECRCNIYLTGLLDVFVISAGSCNDFSVSLYTPDSFKFCFFGYIPFSCRLCKAIFTSTDHVAIGFVHQPFGIVFSAGVLSPTQIGAFVKRFIAISEYEWFSPLTVTRRIIQMETIIVNIIIFSVNLNFLMNVGMCRWYDTRSSSNVHHQL